MAILIGSFYKKKVLVGKLKLIFVLFILGGANITPKSGYFLDAFHLNYLNDQIDNIYSSFPPLTQIMFSISNNFKTKFDDRRRRAIFF